ncbi:WD40 repeat domain-containing protein (plasmid) [Streptomyces sp. NBC_00257]|uniref:WD40 repeat domain-containing protein n=1 Tax=unclassified Streptomyces TaxID=2593676 RepID=UPI00225A614C|nr:MULTISPECIES: WD40 repeat domain-containing protein [unclassified Streptomyces]MCX5434719.1 WD40 repeat domain-containing protein [Streptomyces sp. NBC_00062]
MSSFPPVSPQPSSHRLQYEVVGQQQPGEEYPERFSLNLSADGHAQLDYEHGPIRQSWSARVEGIVWTRLWEAVGRMPSDVPSNDSPCEPDSRRLEILGAAPLARTVAWNRENDAAGVRSILDSLVAQISGLPSTAIANTLPPLTHQVAAGADRTLPRQEAAAVFGTVGDHSAFALARAGGGFSVFSVDPLKLLGETAEAGQPIRALALGSDRERDLLLTGGDDNAVWAWDLTGDGGLLHARGGHSAAVRAVAAHGDSDDELVYSGGGDGSICAWGGRDGTEVGALTGHDHSINALATARVNNLNLLVSGGDDGTVRVWNTDTGEVLRTLAPELQWVNTVAVTGAQGGLVAAAGSDHVVRVWDIEAGTPTRTLLGHTAAVTGLTFLDLDGRAVLASCSYDGTIRTWDVTAGRALETWSAQDTWPAALAAASSEGGAVLASGGATGTVRVWTAHGTARHSLTADGSPIQALALTERDRNTTAAVGYLDGTVRVWDAATGSLRHVLAPDDGHITSVAFGSEGGTVVCGTDRGTVRVHTTEDGGLQLVPTPHTDRILSLAFLPAAGGTVASAGEDRTVRTWEAATGRPLLRLRGHEEAVTRLIAGQIGDLTALASADEDARILVWDAVSGERMQALRAAHPLCALTFGTVNGINVLAAAEQHGSIRVWDVLSGDEVATFDTDDTVVALTVGVFGGATALLGGTGDKKVRAWRLLDGAPMGQVSVEQTPLALSFSPPETLHVAGSVGLTTIHHLPF